MRTAIIFSLLFFACIFTAAAEVVTSEELANEPEEYDGEMVTFKGEVIGEVMIRGDFAWINVGDDRIVFRFVEVERLVHHPVDIGDAISCLDLEGLGKLVAGFEYER